MKSLLIRNGTVLNPEGKPFRADILVANGKILEISKKIKNKKTKTFNAAGKFIMPGIIDVHAHAREPGNTESENLESAAASAAAGGITTFLAMPNTKPPVDNPEILGRLISKAALLKINILFCAAATKGREGVALSDFEALAKNGAAAFSDDGDPVPDPDLFEKALNRAAISGKPLLEHPEEKSISRSGVINEGAASKTGLPPIPPAAEIFAVTEKLLLCAKTGKSAHFQHISCAESLKLIKTARKLGIKLTCETCPHYFSFSEKDAASLNPDFKMNPPLRNEKDRAAVVKAIKDGTIDIIASDHAPHLKKKDFLNSPFGVTGFETMLPAVFTHLVDKKAISMKRMVELLCKNPAGLLGLKKKGEIKTGKDADLCVFSPAEKKVPETFFSKSSNTPYKGKKLKGWPVLTVCGGNIVFERIGL